jgi:hypothetical protein
MKTLINPSETSSNGHVLSAQEQAIQSGKKMHNVKNNKEELS